MEKLTEFVRDIGFNITSTFEDKKREKAVMSYQRYNEYLLRLEKRYQELVRIEKARELLDMDELDKQDRSLADLQLEFLDKTEAFHQQIYATISTFILMLSHIAGHVYKGQLPIRSVTQFLTYMSKRHEEEKFLKSVKFLQDSVNFRAKYVDHPQQHALHDWMTFSYGSGSCIIYFIRTGNEVYALENFDPYSSNFKPPVAHESFYVSPSHEVVYLCVECFTKTVLESFRPQV
jgi:hypothetical protein